jgi:dipeptide/tripeptide permease
MPTKAVRCRWSVRQRSSSDALLLAVGFMAEVAGNKLAGSLAAYSETIQAGVFYAIFVAIAMVSKVALLMATPVLKRLTAES